MSVTKSKAEDTPTPKTSKNFSVPKRKRIIKRKKGKSKNYFDHNTQAGIVEYKGEEDEEKKKEIYVKKVLPSFEALVENLINVYGFKIMYETKKDLKAQCLEFLYQTTPKFDPEKGSKAFSYFNVVAKNWLTIQSKQNVKRLKTYISSDNKTSFTLTDSEMYESHNTVPSYEKLLEKAEQTKFLKEIVIELSGKARTENEKLCIKAIQEIVDNLDDIDILNKRAVLLYIREITGLTSKQLSVVLASLKKHYRELKKQEKYQK